MKQSAWACEGCPRRPPEAGEMRFVGRIVRLQNLCEIGVRFSIDELDDDEVEGLTELRLLQARPKKEGI